LERAFGEVVRRHEVLRTVFATLDGGPVQLILPDCPLKLEVTDLSGLDDSRREAEATRLMKAEAEQPFDLTKGPLLRAGLLRLAADEHVLLLTMHHIASDAWSLGVLVREAASLYEAFAAGSPSPLAELPMQYADYAVWQRRHLSGERLERQLAYWRQQLAGLGPALELPGAKPRPGPQTYRGGSVTFRVGREATEGLRGAGRAQGATLFMVLLAGFKALLSRYTGREDVAVGTAVAGRGRAELEGLIGFFVNTLVLRTDLAGDPTFSELVGRAREVCLGAYAHDEVPFERVVEELAPERNLSRTPLFQVMFTLQNAPAEELVFSDVRVEVLGASVEAAKFDITLEAREESDGLAFSITYNADIFGEQAARRMAEHYATLLAGAAADPSLPLSRLPLLTDAERRRLLVEFNDTAREYPRERTVHELFAEQARRTPEAVAVVCGEGRLSYRELDERSNRIAGRLRALGVGPETVVGICLGRSAELVSAALGVLKAGGAYLPLDPDYPAQRLGWMVADSDAAVVLTSGEEVERLREAELSGARVVNLDEAGAEVGARSAEAPGNVASAENLAYVIYTSGSTGRPKGVSVPHRGVVRLVKGADYVSVGAEDVFLQLAPFTFDASTFEIWGCLLNGARLVVMPPEKPTLEAIGQALRRQRVTTLWLTSGLFNQMVDERPEDLAGVRRMLAGGDVLSAPHARRFLRSAEGARLINGYGPTENTTFSCCCQRTKESEIGTSVPIGRPIANTQAYVLDARMEPVPVGVSGELYLGGDGLARGYLGRPALTAERFVPDPFGGAGSRLYRTGDVCRWGEEGELEFVGRADAQVKVRGFRVEPGEVEAALRRHAGVREAAVVARGEAADRRRLVAYVIAREGAEAFAADELREHLRRVLPEHMIPSAFVSLEQLPLTPNGKVDRKALPEPEFEAAAGHVAPRTPTEELLAGIWAEVLGVERVSVGDNFFELGGHSLLATRLASRVRELFKVELPLRALFEHPTVGELAGRVEEALRGGVADAPPPIGRVPRGGPLPLSFAQQRLWFIDQLEPGNVAYNLSVGARFRGNLDIAVMERTLSEIIRRHEALRTTFAVADDQLLQFIAPPEPLSLDVIDLQSAAEAEREAEVGRLADAEAQRPFDLARGPLLRAALLRVSPDEHVLLFTTHHIVSDGWSMQVLMREINALYAAYAEGRPSPLAEPPVQYADFAAWQREWLRGEALERHLAYWRRQLAGAPPRLQLPEDRPRPAVQTFRGESLESALPGELSGALRELCRRERATLFMALLAAFQILLQRYSGQDDIVVGTPIAGRNRSETENLIGFFVNSLALRCDLSGDPSFRELLGRVREVTLGAYAHQELPFEKVLEELQPERSPEHTPLFQVFVNMLNLELDEIELPGLVVERLVNPEAGAKFDLTLYVQERAGGVSFRLVYNSDVFAHERMAELLEQYGHLLRQVVSEPDGRISSLSLVTRGARAVLPDPTEALDAGWAGAVHDLFASQARRAPQRLAAADRDEVWSYGELDARGNQLARRLLASGVRGGDVVAIYARRSASLVWALLGTLKAGAAFLVLDPAYPQARLVEYLRAAKPKGWIQLEEAGPPPAALADFLSGSDCLCRVELPARTAAARQGFLSEYEAGDPGVAVGPGDPAYVSFTSGTTGRPKAILGLHGSLTHFTPWLRETFGLRESDSFSMLSGLSHDPLHRDVFTPLQLGGSIRIPDPERMGDPGWLARWLARAEVTVAHLTPAMGQLIAEGATAGDGAAAPGLRYVFFLGDMLTRRDVSLMRNLNPSVTCVNFYGATETQRAVGYLVIPAEQSAGHAGGGPGRPASKETLPLGRGIRDVQLLVVNAAGQLAGVGELGEVYLRSPHIARGYVGDEALTRERFIPNPFTGLAGDRLYKTGDLGRYLPDGSVEALGRADAQVKVRGYRVEPGEVEAALRRHAGVREAVVVARPDAQGQRRLVAYVVAREGAGAVAASELRAHLAERLPDYMVPSAFVTLERLPLTPNGKVDRKALPEPEPQAAAGHVAPRTPTEELLAGIWREVLNLERVSVEDNFFELGGHSLLATRLVSRVRARAGFDLPLRALFERPTVAGLAQILDERRAPEAEHAPIERRPARTVDELLAQLEQDAEAAEGSGEASFSLR
ncbi:MAG TPA: amino acid adenylation domain-containing protein, partial [Pyrinomonadaceae bacterium]|nr:amino acid adenylation domain-containing protein [Pyrinomonadaceae bacterium]